VWSATRFVPAAPPEVLASLTDPELIGIWAPIDFEVDGLRGRRLRSGSHAWVNGSLAGVYVEAEIAIQRESGLSGRVLRAATGALLSGGALDRALRRLAGELTPLDELDDAEFAIAA
jgi:hypothetical protein